MKKKNERLHNLLMQGYSKPLYEWRKDGIYIIQGPFKGSNLNKLYDEDDRVIDYLEAIIDNDASSYKMKWITYNVIRELTNKN